MANSKTASHHAPRGRKAEAKYRVRLAETAAEIENAQRLRYEVFNLELQEGLESSHAKQRDEDEFDAQCDHLLIENIETDHIVGTYRMQPGLRAAQTLGYYSETLFDLSPFEPIRRQTIELGRACIHRDHRHLGVLHMLWSAIGSYLVKHDARYLVGISSLTSQDPAEGAAVYRALREKQEAPQEFLTTPRPRLQFELPTENLPKPDVPKLLRAYLALGANICGPPGIDREFKTIVFLTLLDTTALAPEVRAEFLSSGSSV